MMRQLPRPKPLFKIGDRVRIGTRTSPGTVTAVGFTPMAQPTVIYRVKIDNNQSLYWANRPMTFGPMDEQTIPGKLGPGEYEFREPSLRRLDVVTQLGELA